MIRVLFLAALLSSCARTHIYLKPDPTEPSDPISVSWDGVVCIDHSDKITCYANPHDDN